uniref:Uncharacterized protein n=1 Tax=Cajanus cajan TaxID=3821 RepID=A0A151R2F5_CAJCA|nr:hypothetical protein KK1_042182 [Cajanus cajan]
MGYSFFSDKELIAASVNFDTTGDGGEPEGEYGNPFDEWAGEPGLDELIGLDESTDTGTEKSPTDTSEESERSSSSMGFMPCSLGGTTIRSIGRFPFASTQFTSAPADKRSFTASIAPAEPPEAAQ